jgi:hypothetical protein
VHPEFILYSAMHSVRSYGPTYEGILIRMLPPFGMGLLINMVKRYEVLASTDVGESTKTFTSDEGRVPGVLMATSKSDFESMPLPLASYVKICQSVYGLVVGIFLTSAMDISNVLPAVYTAENAPLIVSTSLLVSIESMENVQLTEVLVSPDTGAHTLDPDVSMDYALIEYREAMFHLGMKNFTIPPTGI